jgi:HUS1 checkpoint protein
MKLAKKNDQALLSFEISGQTRVGHRLRVAHDVKIEVMRPADVDKLREPLCPEPDVSLFFGSPCLWSHFSSYISFSRLFKSFGL